MKLAPRVAIAHDYLTQRGGAERVVLSLSRAFPEAPIYTTLYQPETTYPEFADRDIRTSWLDRVPVARAKHRATLPILPWASSSISIDADIVIASSSGWAHGFRTNGKKLVYCYSPARWLYESDRYLGSDSSRSVSTALKLVGPSLRRWDKRQAAGADRYLAISTVTQQRIERTYGRSSEVVPAPHSMQVPEGPTEPLPVEDGYFLVVSRLLRYKNVRPIVQAFAGRSERLVVIGTGPQKAELEKIASPNVTFFENVSDEQMKSAYDHCKALIAASHEDFGLTPLEAAVHGKPTVALRWGGFLDTIVEGETGVFFDEPTPVEIGAAVDRVSERAWSRDLLRQRADDFSEAKFIERIEHHVRDLTGQSHVDQALDYCASCA